MNSVAMSNKEIQSVLKQIRRTKSLRLSGRKLRAIRRDVSFVSNLLGNSELFRKSRQSLREDERIVAGMATMPSRIHSFKLAFASLVRQVDHLYLYLDGHERVPEIVRQYPNVTAIFSHDKPGLHANGKLLGASMEQQSCIYICADDDIYFTRTFVPAMRKALKQYEDRAVVGIHGVDFTGGPSDSESRINTYHYGDTQKSSALVDIIGTGAAMFSTAALTMDISDWPQTSMADLGVAIAAVRRGIPLYSIAREKPLVVTIEENQKDSLSRFRRKGNPLQEKLRKELRCLKENAKTSTHKAGQK